MKCVVNEKVKMPKACVGLPTARGIYRSSDAASTMMLVLSKHLRIVWNSSENHELLTPNKEKFWEEYIWSPMPKDTEVVFTQE